MTVKEILDDFQKREENEKARWEELQAQPDKEIHARVEKANRCFNDLILPSLRAVEKDLQNFGLWYKIHIGQVTSPFSDDQHIGEVVFNFYPERFQTRYHSQRVIDASYKAIFRPTGDYRKITFTQRIPRRLPQGVEVDEESFRMDEIDKKRVDAFLERFVKMALAAHGSDRLLL